MRGTIFLYVKTLWFARSCIHGAQDFFFSFFARFAMSGRIFTEGEGRGGQGRKGGRGRPREGGKRGLGREGGREREG